MKLIKRILGDIIGVFTIPICAIFQQRTIVGMIADIFGIFFLIFQFMWFVIKSIWKFLTVWKDFKNPLGKIFIFYSIFSSIAAGVLTTFLPDLALATYNFMPISIVPIQKIYTSLVQNAALSNGVLNGVTSVGSFVGTLAGIFVALLTVVMLTGASLIPIFAYIWVILLLGFIWAAIAEFGYGSQNAFKIMFKEWWDWDVYNFRVSVFIAVRWWLYIIPVVNVCFYRILLKKDRESRFYPPVDARGKLDHEKLRHLYNSIYSRVVK